MCRFLCQIKEHHWRAPQGAAKIGDYYREYQSRINSPGSSDIEFTKGEPASLQIAQNIAAYKIARNNKENIDADKSAFEATDLQMKKNHADNRNGAQPGDLGAKKTDHTVNPRAGANCRTAACHELDG